MSPLIIFAISVPIAACALGAVAAYAGNAQDAVPCDSGDLDRIYEVRTAIREVERPRTKAQADAAYRRERAVGNYQIRPCMIAEANRILNCRRFILTDATMDKSAEQIFMTFSVYWANKTGDWSQEGIARRWNSGPTGHRRMCSIPYWWKVKSQLAKKETGK